MIIKVDLSRILAESKTHTTASLGAGAISLPVLDSSNFASNDLIIIGALGQEKSELKVISLISSETSISLPALASNHGSGTLVQKVYYDQVILESSSDGTTWGSVSTYNITGDQAVYEFNHTTGASSTYYRYRFYNSSSGVYSEYTNEASLNTPSIVDTVLSEMRVEFSDTTKISNYDLFMAFAEADLVIAREILRSNDDFKKTTTTIDLVSGTSDYSLPANFVGVDKVMIKYTSSETMRKSVNVDTDWGTGLEDFSGWPYHDVFQDASTGLWYVSLRKVPTENVTGGMKVYGTKQATRMMSTSDTPNTPNPLMYLDTFKNGMREWLYRSKLDRQDLATLYQNKFADNLDDITRFVNSNDNSDKDDMYAASVLNGIYNAVE